LHTQTGLRELIKTDQLPDLVLIDYDAMCKQ